MVHYTDFQPTKSFMGVSEVLPRLHHHPLPPWIPPCFLSSDSFFSLYMYRRLPSGNVVRAMPCNGNYSSLLNPIMSARKGHSSTTIGQGLCEVVWTVECNLAAGKLLFLTGDTPVLGCWQTEMAVLMTPLEHANLWQAKVKIPAGVDIKYNYFIKEETNPSCDIIWRCGPEFSLSVPLATNQDRKVMVRDLWMTFNTERFPAYIWGSWLEESCSFMQPLVSSQDEHDISKLLEIDSKGPKTFSNDPAVKDKFYSSATDAAIVNRYDDGPNLGFSKRDQPTEEPWLSQSTITFLVSEDKMTRDLSSSIDIVKDDVTQLDSSNEPSQVKDKLLPTDRSNLILKDDSVSTVLLVNSSICTMQRIAVLEDGKLVELLLEPVKADVHCDDVYLGVVTKLVPYMSGAFVNIGSASLMEIKKNRKPFIFPPFGQKKKKQESNGSVLETNEAPTHENGHASHVDASKDLGEYVSPNDLAPYMHDENEEVEVDDEFDISEVKDDVNGSVVDYVEDHGTFKHFLNGKENHKEDENMSSSLPVQTETPNELLMSHEEYMGDAGHILTNKNMWDVVRIGTKIIVQVVKEGLGRKGPTLTAYPALRSRFWILMSRCDRIGISKKIAGAERTRLKVIAKSLQPPGFGLTVRTVAVGHSYDDLQKDLEGLLSTWKNIMESAKSAALAADEGVDAAVPVILHRAMGQTLSVVQDYFNDKVTKMVVDSPRTYHEVTNYLQEMAPDLCDRVELHNKRIPLFDEFDIEEEINNILSKRVPLAKGGYLVIEQTEALVSIDVNGGHIMFLQGNSQEKVKLDINIAAAKQIARELRLRDIGGIIVVDFIDMADDSKKRLVYEEMKRAVERDRSIVEVSELSKYGLMEIIRKRVRPSVTFMISEPCTCCHATGRVEALETSFSKIEQQICRMLATMDQKADPENPKSWPRFILRVDSHMCNYLTSGKRTKLATLSSSLKVWIILKVDRGFTRGAFEVKPFTDDKACQSRN